MRDGKYTIVAVEGGGTMFRLAICEVPSATTTTTAAVLPTTVARAEIDSSHDEPQRTLSECVAFLLQHKPPGGAGYDALGVATFGPVGVAPTRPAAYGCILPTTPKPAWKGVDLLTPLRRACQGDDDDDEKTSLAVLVDTDVNAPALAEYLEERRRRPDVACVSYITVGTGIGVGLVVNGNCVHGRMHPEGGHVAAQPLPDDPFPGYSWGTGSCPYRGKHTVEGLASSVALTERLEQMTQQSNLNRSVLKDLPDDHEIWDHAANALANLCVTLCLTLSMEKIVLGGGLMNRSILLEKIRTQTVKLLNGYLGELTDQDMETLITVSRHGDDAGLNGAIVLAQKALASSQDDKTEDKKRATKTKLVAYGHGIWHGMLIGAVATAVVVKYIIWPRRR